MAASSSSTSSHAERASALVFPNVSDASIAFLMAAEVSYFTNRQEDGLRKIALGAKALTELSRRKDALSFIVCLFVCSFSSMMSKNDCIDFMEGSSSFVVGSSCLQN